jgi:hypothetical protein
MERQRKYKLVLTISDETDKQLYAIKAGTAYYPDDESEPPPWPANAIAIDEILDFIGSFVNECLSAKVPDDKRDEVLSQFMENLIAYRDLDSFDVTGLTPQ